MEKTVIICCKALEDELMAAYRECHCNYQVIWMDPRLHIVPAKLNEALQNQFLSLQSDVKRVLLGFGFCGNALAGLKTGPFEVIMPKADDCISIMLGSDKIRRRISGTYFLSRSFLNGEYSICQEYTYTVGKYGSKRAKSIFDAMFRNYTTIGVLDTGCYDPDDIMGSAHMLADSFGLSLSIIPASNLYLKKLLSGAVSGAEFLRIPPNSNIKTPDINLLSVG